MIDQIALQFDTNYGLALASQTQTTLVLIGLTVTSVATLALRGQLSQMLNRGKKSTTE